MLDRRSFIENSLFVSILPFIGIKIADPSINFKNKSTNTDFSDKEHSVYGKIPKRIFISHRGVNLDMSIAGENSIEAIKLAKRAGFEAIEFDLRLSADKQWVVMHDDTLNRTALNLDGSQLVKKEYVAEKTLHEIKTQFILKAKETRNQSSVPTMVEFLLECKRCSLLPFLHVKEEKLSEKAILNFIRQCDETIGRGNYIITSNNNLNKVIRKVGVKYITLMGILYQTTFEEIENLENCIMAVSISRFNAQEYKSNIARANLAGIPIESSADSFDKLTIINDYGIDIVSTDYLVADLKNYQNLLINQVSDGSYENYNYTGTLSNGSLNLKRGQTITLKENLPPVYLGGIYIEIELTGKCDVQMANQKFSINTSLCKQYMYQVIVYNNSPNFLLTANGDCTIKQISVKIAKF